MDRRLTTWQHRAKFRPNNYHWSAPNPVAELGTHHGSGRASSSHKERPSVESESSGGEGSSPKKRWGLFGRRELIKIKKTGKSIAPLLIEEGPEDNVLEVWFAGCHSGMFFLCVIIIDMGLIDPLTAVVTDVGGGAVSNGTTSSLANISLRWMIREVIASGCGILFDASALMRANITLDPEPTTAEVDLDMQDAVQPLHDELKLDPLWWLLEIIPLQYSWQDADGIWHKEWK